MPNSLRCKIKHLCHNGTLTERERDRILKALEQAQWIPVSERLPEIHNYSDNYLVTLKRGGIYIAMFIESDGKYWWLYDDVEAWMPLPEPYKVKSEEDNAESEVED